MLQIMVGYKPHGNEAIIPNYSTWNKKALIKHVDDLKSDICDALKLTLVSPKQGLNPDAVTWLAMQFDRWQATGFADNSLSTALEFEQNVGVLLAKDFLDVPPYAELLIQQLIL